MHSKLYKIEISIQHLRHQIQELTHNEIIRITNLFNSNNFRPPEGVNATDILRILVGAKVDKPDEV